MTADKLGGRKTLKVASILDEFEKDRIKALVDIVGLFFSFGVALEKKGQSYVGRCPWHEDSTPSLSVNQEKGLYNCFGCGESGDAFTLVEKMKGVSFREALDYLKAGGFPNARPSPLQKPQPILEAPVAKAGLETDAITLDDVADAYRKSLPQSGQALAYLEGRGLKDKSLYSRLALGYCDGSLSGRLSARQKESLKALGVLSDSGREVMSGRVTVPLLDSEGRAVGLYGRSIQKGSFPPHLYLKGPHRGLVNGKAARVYSEEIILTESVIDALSLNEAGFDNVIPCYGNGGFTEDHLASLKEGRVEKVLIAFDSDEAGRNGALALKERLVSEGFKVKTAFPESFKDWNEALVSGIESESLKKLFARAEVFGPNGEERENRFERRGNKYIFGLSGVDYRLLGVRDAFVSSLRVNVKAEHEGKTYIDNADLYSARSRAGLSQSLAAVFDLPAARIERDLLFMLKKIEEERDRLLFDTPPEVPSLSPEDEKIGMEFLTSPALFETIVSDAESLGYVGEDNNKLLLYIAASSRKLQDPISVIVISESAAGKSYLVDTVKALIPPEDVVSMTSLSEQALNYLPENGLKHKFLVMGEAVHGEAVEHQVREMLSAHELARLVTTKDERTGELSSKMVRKEVVVSSVMSSTSYELNPENASRCFLINSDESEEQTKKIHRAQRKKYSISHYEDKNVRIPSIIKKHHAAQRLLRQRNVVNPFAELLDFPTSMMRSRRDHDRFLDLIACVCFLRQFQKEEKAEGGLSYIECDLVDYGTAYGIMRHTLPSTLSNFPKAAQALYEELRKIAKAKAKAENLESFEVRLTQREIREATDLNQRFIKRYLKVLCDYEYVKSGGLKSRGSRYSYTLVSDEPLTLVDVSSVPTPEEMGEKLKNL